MAVALAMMQDTIKCPDGKIVMAQFEEGHPNSSTQTEEDLVHIKADGSQKLFIQRAALFWTDSNKSLSWAM